MGPETTKIGSVIDESLMASTYDREVITPIEKNVIEASLIAEENQFLKSKRGKRTLFWNERLEARRLRKRSRSAVSSKTKQGFFKWLSDTTKVTKLKKSRRV